MLVMLLIGTFTLFSKDIYILSVLRMLSHTRISYSMSVVSSMMLLFILLLIPGRVMLVIELLLALSVVS